MNKDICLENMGTLSMKDRAARLQSNVYRGRHHYTETVFIHPMFSKYLWIDLIQATGRLFAAPSDYRNFFDYVSQLLAGGYPKPYFEICIDTKSHLKSGDLAVLKHFSTSLGEIVFLTAQDGRRYQAAGLHGSIRGVDEECLYKISPNITSRKIHVGDIVNVLSNKVPKELSALESAACDEVEDDQLASPKDSPTASSAVFLELDEYEQYGSFESKKISRYAKHTNNVVRQVKGAKGARTKMNASSKIISTRTAALEIGETYPVAEVYDNNLVLATKNRFDILPIRNVNKMITTDSMPKYVKDEEMDDIIRKTIYAFFERKGVLRKCSIIRQSILHDLDMSLESVKSEYIASTGQADITAIIKNHVMIQLSVDYNTFLKACEVLKYVKG